MWWTRLKALIIKELLAILRDPKGRMILIVPPIAQLVVFSFAATLEVTHVDVAILNRDSGRWGQEVVHRIHARPTFGRIFTVDSPEALRSAIDMQQVIAAIQIGPSFSRDIEASVPADIQIIFDGRKSNASQVVGGYLAQIVSELAAETPAGKRAAPGSVGIMLRNWFNPNLNYKWFIVPNLVAAIALLIGLIVSALSIARERELGTFDQLLVSPLRPHEILAGKVIAPMMIGLFHMTIFILAARLVFSVPLRGSLLLLYGSGLFYLLSVIGVGLLISALSMTQQQAILGAFLFMVPAMLLSGFATPIDNMPNWLQPLTRVNPLRYFLVIVIGVFIKDMPWQEIVSSTIPLALIAITTMGGAAWLFRRRLE